MNNIILKGLLRDIQYSHTTNEVEYNKANLVISKPYGKEDIICVKFKKFSSPYTEEQEVSLSGNVRSYSSIGPDGKNKVNIYVFTYFDIPTEEDIEQINHFEIDGRICKIEQLRETKAGKHNLHFTLANNLMLSDSDRKLNNYIPMAAWGKLAREISENYAVGDKVVIKGELHSRIYKKVLESGEVEFRTAHEGLVQEISNVDEL